MQLYGQVSTVLDQHLKQPSGKELLEDFPISTKSDLILEGAQVHIRFSFENLQKLNIISLDSYLYFAMGCNAPQNVVVGRCYQSIEKMA